MRNSDWSFGCFHEIFALRIVYFRLLGFIISRTRLLNYQISIKISGNLIILGAKYFTSFNKIRYVAIVHFKFIICTILCLKFLNQVLLLSKNQIL